jgi:hypothetical protein
LKSPAEPVDVCDRYVDAAVRDAAAAPDVPEVFPRQRDGMVSPITVSEGTVLAF